MKGTCLGGYCLYMLWILSFMLPKGNLYADASWDRKIDGPSKLTWNALMQGGTPDEPYWEYIRPQRDYLRKTYGDDISTTYELYLKELARLDGSKPAIEDSRILKIKTIKRWPDMIILHGENLAGWTGGRLDNLRVYACHLNQFVPIPFQFDEITREGIKVMPDGGPDANPQDGNGVLDPQDELLFMAHDLGDRVQPGQWVEDIVEFLEITVQDPLDGGKGWCYLLRFAGEPPLQSPLNYATYNEKYNQHYGFYMFGETMFNVMGGKLYRQAFPRKWKIPDYAGGNFSNFVDRTKYRVRVRLFFGTLKLTVDEDVFFGDTLAIRDGPVRCIRRCWLKVRLPLGIKSPRLNGDINGYDSVFFVPAELNVPFNPGAVLTDFTMYSGSDLNANALGSRWYNSNNLAGFHVDGKMTQDETAMNNAVEHWRLVTGPYGTMMNRSLWDPGFERQAKIQIQFTDDVTLEDPPEYHAGQIGMAYSYSTIKSLKPGKYFTQLDWYFPPWFNRPEETGRLNMDKVKAYLNLHDNPVKISTGSGNGFLNQPGPKRTQLKKSEL